MDSRVPRDGKLLCIIDIHGIGKRMLNLGEASWDKKTTVFFFFISKMSMAYLSIYGEVCHQHICGT